MNESNHPKRAYHSPTRKRQAEETRQRILASARRLFLAQGYTSTTVDMIAKAAEISPKTVTAIFGSKQGILTALFHPLVFGSRYHEVLEQLRRTPEPAGRIALIAQLTRQVYETLAPEFALLRGASAMTPDLGEVVQQVETRRRAYQARFMTFLEERGMLPPDRTREEALDELWALTASDLYHRLVIECGWTPNHYESWLTSVLRQRLLASP